VRILVILTTLREPSGIVLQEVAFDDTLKLTVKNGVICDWLSTVTGSGQHLDARTTVLELMLLESS
jgi:hypothetical protein